MRRTQLGGEQIRRNRCHHAVDPGCTRAERDQREHVEAAVPDRGDAPSKERPARPEHDRRRQRHLDPGIDGRRNQAVDAEDVPAHFNSQQRQGQNEPEHKTPLHVAQLRIGTVACAWGQRLQRHTTDRAVSRTISEDFRVHGAGPLASGRRCLGCGCCRVMMTTGAMT